MKRKSILTGAVLLSIIYSFVVVGTIVLGAAALIYFFVGQSVQVINDLFYPLMEPFLLYGKIWMIVFIFMTILASIFLLIISTRFMKYSGINKELFQKKKKMMIFYLICLIFTMGGYTYWLINNILTNGFGFNMVTNVTLSIVILIHVLSFILFLYGISKEISPIVEKETQKEISITTTETRPAIYTAGLEEVVEEQKEEKVEKQEKPLAQLKESESSKKLIESIGKLDQMRKEGAISAQEYTRLRGQLIKKFIK